MKNYDLTQIAGLSITIDYDFNEIHQHSIKQYFEQLIQNYAPHLFNQQIELNIDISKGSVKVYIVVLGLIYAAISQYGSFRSGIDYMISDAKSLKKIIKNQLMKDGIDEADIIVTKRLQSLPDKIRLVLLAIERLEHSLISLSKEEQLKQICSIKTSVINILKLLNNKTEQALFLHSINEKYIPELPPYFPTREERIALLKIQAREEDIFPGKNIYSSRSRKEPYYLE